MSRQKIIDPVIFLQISSVRKYMERHNLSPKQLAELDKEFHIFEYLREGYEPFHLMGIDGILDELDELVKSNLDVKDNNEK